KSALKKTVQKKSGDSDHDYDNDDYTLNEFEEAQLREAILTSKEEYESKNSMQEEETIFSSNDTITNDKSNVKRKKSGIQEFKQDNKNLNKRLRSK
ncbi:19500_t:CDS:2, partial [Entrophospora sp. SA101]